MAHLARIARVAEEAQLGQPRFVNPAGAPRDAHHRYFGADPPCRAIRKAAVRNLD